MRDIEGIEEAVKTLSPHWERVEEHFEKENAYFKNLLKRDHDELGRILKCHLLVEHYLDRYLREQIGLQHLDEARLTFIQKARLIPSAGVAASFVKPSICHFNSIRNKFSHNLDAKVSESDLGPMNNVLKIARSETKFPDTISKIEAFTTVACTWLLLPPKDIQEAFIAAMKKVRFKNVSSNLE